MDTTVLNTIFIYERATDLESTSIFLIFIFFLLTVTPRAYGSLQARGSKRPIPDPSHTCDLGRSLANTRSKPHMRPRPQLAPMPDP